MLQSVNCTKISCTNQQSRCGKSSCQTHAIIHVMNDGSEISIVYWCDYGSQQWPKVTSSNVKRSLFSATAHIWFTGKRTLCNTWLDLAQHLIVFGRPLDRRRLLQEPNQRVNRYRYHSLCHCWQPATYCANTKEEMTFILAAVIGKTFPEVSFNMNLVALLSYCEHFVLLWAMLKLASSCMLPFVKRVLGGKMCDQTWIYTVWWKCHLSVCVGRWILCTMCLEGMHTAKQLVCRGASLWVRRCLKIANSPCESGDTKQIRWSEI